MKKFIVVFCDDHELNKVGSKDVTYDSFEEAQQAMEKAFLEYTENFYSDEYEVIKNAIASENYQGDDWLLYNTGAYINSGCSCVDWKIIELDI